MQRGRRTQLLTEAVIAAHGGFEGVDADGVTAMEYWQLTGRRGEPGTRSDVMPADWDAGEARESLQSLASIFDDAGTPYASRPNPTLGAAFPRYDHLARVDEWRIGETRSNLPSGQADTGGDPSRHPGSIPPRHATPRPVRPPPLIPQARSLSRPMPAQAKQSF